MAQRPRQMTTHVVNSKQMPNPQVKFQVQNNKPHIIKPQNAHIDKIHREIMQVDLINRELLKIADKMKGMSPMMNNQTNHMIIDRIENDIRASLNQLIQNIMQFFKDIDGKLKNLGAMIDNQFNRRNSNLSESEPVTRLEQTMDAKYDILSERIQGLEVALMETQLNEKKLIQVIQGMMEKYQVMDQPTLIRDSPQLQNQFRKNRVVTTSSNTIKYRPEQKAMDPSQNIRQMTSISHANLMKPENKKKSIYQHLYTIEQSVVNQGASPQQFRLRQIEQDPSEQVFIKKLYSKQSNVSANNTVNNNFLNESKKSLRGQQMYQPRSMNKPDRSNASQASTLDDKQHRLNFMMDKLNF